MKLRYIGLCMVIVFMLERCLVDWNRPVHWDIVLDRCLGVVLTLLFVWWTNKVNQGVES